MIRTVLASVGITAAVFLGVGTPADAGELHAIDAFSGGRLGGSVHFAPGDSAASTRVANLDGMMDEREDGAVRALWESAPMLDPGTRYVGPWVGFRISSDPLGDAWGPGFGPADPVSAGRRDHTLTGILGVRARARIDSRLGAVYSRFGLSFEHAIHGRDGLAVAGPSGGGASSGRPDRSRLNVIRLDSIFGVWMSDSVAGFMHYRAVTDDGTAPDHRVQLRLRFDF